jgi:DNA polymerase-3 subunit delta'
MSIEAQNCFLKTLEEPKGKTILILICSNPDLLLPTIFSRCQTVKFFPVKTKEIKDYLKTKVKTAKETELLSDLAEGRPGRAIDFILNPEKLEDEKKLLADLLKIIDSNLAQKFQYVKSLDIESQSLKEILEVLERYFRNLLLLKTEIKKEDLFADAPDVFKKYSLPKINKIIKLIEKINLQTSLTNASPKLALEILLMEF